MTKPTAAAAGSTAESEFGQAGREETVQRGTYLFNAIEAAAADWLQDKTLENVDPEVPAGGWNRPATNVLRIARGNVVNSAGHMIVSGRPDLPASVNARLATALLEWVDEFRLSEEDLPHLSRAVLSRLLVLQPGTAGLGPTEMARIRACDAGLQWLRQARDEARPLFRRTGWVNVAHVVRVASESAGQEAESARESQISRSVPPKKPRKSALKKRASRQISPWPPSEPNSDPAAIGPPRSPPRLTRRRLKALGRGGRPV